MMKFPLNANFSNRFSPGFALIVTLSFIVLVTIVMVAFFTNISTDYESARSYANGIFTKNLADSAVQVVIGQIKTATDGGDAIAWASQPGMIRTYDSAGNPVGYYKLYSSSELAVKPGIGQPFNPADDVDPAWDTQRAIYVDLNSPVTDHSGSLNYPIIDPRAYTTGSGGADGFSYSQTTMGGKQINKVVLPGMGSQQSLPMPVKWIYVLRDGSLTVPTGLDPSTKAAVWSGAVSGPVPSRVNPIVGRIAFWTDDDTCKVNLNTACGDLLDPGLTPISSGGGAPPKAAGAFWDTPHCNTVFEHDSLATYQPAQHEYQRYPGHPATVYLTGIFPQITRRDQLFKIVPRINGGGSEGGTQVPVTQSNGAYTPINLDTDRLYASSDELLFASSASNGLRTLNEPLFSKETLSRTKFFITAHSRAPEVNLFNKPRIGIWPITSDLPSNPNSVHATAFDRLIAFCGHIGTAGNGNDYFFQRNPYTMGQAGSGGSDPQGGCSSPIDDYATIARNQALYSYLQDLSRRTIPGFGGSFRSKYPLDGDQILTEIFDYIRCINLCDDTLAYQNSNTQTNDLNCYTPGSTRSGNKDVLKAGHAQVAPIHIGNTMGFGRFPTVTEVGLHFICTGDGRAGTYANPSPLVTNTTTIHSYSGDFLPPPAARNPVLTGSDGPKNELDYYIQSNQPYNYDANGVNLTGTISNFSCKNRRNITLPTGNPLNYSVQAGRVVASDRRVEGALVLKTTWVTQGNLGIAPSFQVEVDNLASVKINGVPVFANGILTASGPTKTGTTRFAYTASATTEFPPFNSGQQNGGVDLLFANRIPARVDSNGYKIPGDNAAANVTTPNCYYPFVTVPFTVPNVSVDGGGTMLVASGTIQIRLYYGGFGTNSPKTLVQTVNIDLGKLDGAWPVPDLPVKMPSNCSDFSVERYWTWRQDGAFIPQTAEKAPVQNGRFNGAGQLGNYMPPVYSNGGSDSVRTLVPGYPTSDSSVQNAVPKGDYRILAATDPVPASYFVPHSAVRDSSGVKIANGYTVSRDYAPSFIRTLGSINSFIYNPASGSPNLTTRSGPDIPSIPISAQQVPLSQTTGDYDNGTGYNCDGAYINKPDEGTQFLVGSNQGAVAGSGYFDSSIGSLSLPAYFSPNRQVCSPGMFGSLPTGVVSGHPWQTLLFRPPQLANGELHPQAASPTGGPPYTRIPDHLIMDLFWMPVVEPYAISEPFSTAGKINMNYQIAPFTYISRRTALCALLRSERFLAIPNGNLTYKQHNGAGSQADNRHQVNLSETNGTLRQFEARFQKGDIFRSATEICDQFLVPEEESWGGSESGTDLSQLTGNAVAFWAAHSLTGDNCRERPYATLYARLTTKSNTYTVHFRVQSLQKTPASNPDQWDEKKDKVIGEYRGSSTIERYIDASDPALPDFASDASRNETLDSYFRFRVINNKKFEP